MSTPGLLLDVFIPALCHFCIGFHWIAKSHGAGTVFSGGFVSKTLRWISFQPHWLHFPKPTLTSLIAAWSCLTLFISFGKFPLKRLKYDSLRGKQSITILPTDGGFSATDKARFLLNFNQGHLLHSSILPTKSSDQNIKDYTGVTIYAETPMYC